MNWRVKRKPGERLVLVALFSALTWVGANLRIMLFPPLPFTLQNFMVIMAGVVLGPRDAVLSQLVYLLLGLAGVPVFSQGGGLSYLFQPGFGFLLGFVGAAAVTGAVSRLLPKPTFWSSFGVAITGMLSIYLIALPYLYFLNRLVFARPVGLVQLAIGLSPFLLGDLVKAFVIAGLIPPLWARLQQL
ncbi:MAG TPA: biotin transporter BioY [Capillibacterium sp.]